MGSLSGKLIVYEAPINVVALLPIDYIYWVDWGYSPSIHFVHENVLPAYINDYFPPPSPDLQSNDSGPFFSWGDGTPVQFPVPHIIQTGQFTTSLNNSYNFDVNILNTTGQVLRVWVSSGGASSTFTARLNETPHPVYTDSTSFADGYYELTYFANFPPTTISIQWKNTSGGPLYLRAAALAGDPHFVGFDGDLFDYQGRDNGCYNLLSDGMINVNARFRMCYGDITVVSAIGVRLRGLSGIADLKFGQDGSLKFRGSFRPKISRTSDSAEIKNYDVFPPEFKYHTREVLELTTIEATPYNLAILRMREGGICYLNISMSVMEGYTGPATGIVGQTMLPHKYRRHNGDFEVHSLFDLSRPFNKFFFPKLL